MLSLLLAFAAIIAQPITPPADFVSDVLFRCNAVMTADFVGCEGNGTDDVGYAGLIFIDGKPSLQTGP